MDSRRVTRRIEECGFVEGRDYLISQNWEIKSTQGGDRKSLDYHLTLDVAKNLSQERDKIMTPLEAIHQFCVDCVGSIYDVRECGGDHCLNGGCDAAGVCYFYPYRMGTGRPSVKLIRKTCSWCMGGSQEFVRDCWTPDCALHPYRMGRNPNITEETRVQRRERALKHGLGRSPVLDSSA